jgi:hypothetical protein
VRNISSACVGLPTINGGGAAGITRDTRRQWDPENIGPLSCELVAIFAFHATLSVKIPFLRTDNISESFLGG